MEQLDYKFGFYWRQHTIILAYISRNMAPWTMLYFLNSDDKLFYSFLVPQELYILWCPLGPAHLLPIIAHNVRIIAHNVRISVPDFVPDF